jgi:hypothetical protein
MLTTPKRLLAIAAIAFTAPACDDGPGPDPDPVDPIDLGTPRQVDPTEPGILEVSPGVLVLAPGATAQLEASLYDSAGAPLADPATLVWTSDDEAVATVDGAGLVTAVAEGQAEVSGTDGVHGFRLVPVSVSIEADPDAPASIAFEAPLVVLERGVAQSVAFTVYAGSGAPLTGGATLISLSYEGAAGVTVQSGAAFDLLASGVGAGRLVALELETGEPLAGGAFVVSVEPGTTVEAGETSSATGCTDWVLDSCGMSSAEEPRLFTGVGATTSLWLQTWRSRTCAGVYQGMMRFESPDQLLANATGIVGLDGSGDLTALAPGAVTVSPRLEGQSCGCYTVSVLPDVGGDWMATCEGGVIGGVTLASLGARVYYGDVSAPRAVSVGGTSCAVYTDPESTCRGHAYLQITGVHATGGSPNCFDRLVDPGASCNCSEGAPCVGGLLGEQAEGGPTCLDGGHPTFDSPDSFSTESCDFVRGTPECAGASFDCTEYVVAEDPQPFSACDGEWIVFVCNRLGPGRCPETYEWSEGRFETGVACVCDSSALYAECCAQAEAAIAAQTWVDEVPTIDVLNGWPDFVCKMEGLWNEDADWETFHSIYEQLRACNAAICGADDAEEDAYGQACAAEFCAEHPEDEDCQYQ